MKTLTGSIQIGNLVLCPAVTIPPPPNVAFLINQMEINRLAKGGAQINECLLWDR